MHRFLISEAIKHTGEKVELLGWVANRRDHGKIIFIDLRDRSGNLQVVFVPSDKESYQLAEKLRPEWVVRIEGQIIKRPPNMINPKIESGKVELSVEKLEILSLSETPPISVEGDGYDIGEESRMQYRYLDLRRERMQKNFINRHKVIKLMRDFLDNESFLEIETPILTKSTPEGARDYLVPSRTQQGKFYALPQSPQQYKQLLMVSGFERYFQIAKCFRDEDPRGDRQPEFTQLDIEMSFVKREDVMEIIERMIIHLIKTLYPEKKIQEVPFPILQHKEAIEKYGTDRPDLRKDKNNNDLLAFCWVVDFPFFEKTEEGKWTFTHNPFSMPNEDHINNLLKKKNIENIVANQYDIVLNGAEVGGGSIRSHRIDVLRKVFEIIGYKKNMIDSNFDHMFEAFKFGVPPHGGIALGLDRIISLLQKEPNIREVIAFPKTGDGRDFMMQAPSEVDKKQLKELGIKVSIASKKDKKPNKKTKKSSSKK